jgi:hypothetical protein
MISRHKLMRIFNRTADKRPAAHRQPRDRGTTRYGSLRLERLEDRQMLSVSPMVAAMHSPHKVASVTTLASSLDPAPVGQDVTFTASVVGATAGTPTGTVDFRTGTHNLTPTPIPLVAGKATFDSATLGAGIHNITAVYSGNGSLAGSKATVVEIVEAATTTTLVAQPNPGGVGQPVTLVATVSYSPGQAPAGNAGLIGAVDFYDNGSTTPLNPTPVWTNGQGVAQFTISTLPQGQNNLTATFEGSSVAASSTTTTPLVENIEAAATVALASSLNPSPLGQNVTFTATVTPVVSSSATATPTTPTGYVDFRDGQTDLTPPATPGAPDGIPLDSTGTATFSTSLLTAGVHRVTAVYSGDATYGGYTSAVVLQDIQAPTQTALVVQPSPTAGVNQPVTLVATVSYFGTPASTALGLMGKMDFFDSVTTGTTTTITQLNTSPVYTNVQGVAQFTVPSLAQGVQHNLYATFEGTPVAASSTSPQVAETIEAAATTTLVSSLNPSVFGQAVTFTATVAPVVSSSSTTTPATPTGYVDFRDGQTDLTPPASPGAPDGIPLDSTGTATFTTSSLAVGGHSITAVYSGDSVYGGDLSTALVQVVQPASTGTVVGSGTILKGQDQYTVNVAVNDGVPVSVNASNPPSTLVFTDTKAGDTFTATTISSVVIQTEPPLMAPQGKATAGSTPQVVIASPLMATITGTCTLTNGTTTSSGYNFVAYAVSGAPAVSAASIPVYRNGMLTIVVTGPGNFQYSGGGVIDSGSTLNLTLGISVPGPVQPLTGGPTAHGTAVDDAARSELGPLRPTAQQAVFGAWASPDSSKRHHPFWLG